MTHHPIRDAWIISYQGDDEAIALFITNENRALSTIYPYARGKTRAEAEANAEKWRQSVIDQHEAKYVARVEAAAKARARSAEKTAA